MKQNWVILLLNLLIGYSQAQNLVPNPGFEANYGIPTCMDQFYWCNVWYNATTNSPDYIHALSPYNGPEFTCPTAEVNTLVNWLGSQSPHGGQAFAALHTYVDDGDAREYIGVRLLEPMQTGRSYEVKMYVSKADLTAYNSNLGILFTRYEEKASNEIEKEPSLYIPEIVTITNGWYEFKRVFVADTNYQYLTLGNFFEYDDPRFKLDGPYGNTLTELGSYYIDDVSVNPMPIPKPDLGSDKVICSNTTITFSSNITASSYLWNTGATTADITVNEPGEYILCVSSFGETQCDTVLLKHIPAPDIELGDDIALCPQDSFEITLSVEPYSGAWSTGISSNEIKVNNYGTYHVTVNNESNCRDEDSVHVYEKCPECLDELNLNPNPVIDFLSFKVLYNSNDECSYYIVDTKGSVVLTEKKVFNSGYNYGNVDCSNLQTGTYILFVQSKCGKISKVFQRL